MNSSPNGLPFNIAKNSSVGHMKGALKTEHFVPRPQVPSLIYRPILLVGFCKFGYFKRT